MPVQVNLAKFAGPESALLPGRRVRVREERRQQPTGCRSTRRTACTARPATSRTRRRTSCGSRPKAAAGRTTRTCDAAGAKPDVARLRRKSCDDDFWQQSCGAFASRFRRPTVKFSQLVLGRGRSPSACWPAAAGADHDEDQHLDRPELAPGRGHRHLRQGSREAHRRPLQGPDLLQRLARRRARIDRGRAAGHPGTGLLAPPARCRTSCRRPRSSTCPSCSATRPMPARCSTARSARTC